MKKDHSNERGGASIKFLIVMAVVGCCAYAGYKYIPIRYQAYQFQDLIQHYADVAAGQGKPATWAAEQLQKSEAEYEIPSNAAITPVAQSERIEVRVQYTQPIEFPGYTYQYEFDYTAKSVAFISFK